MNELLGLSQNHAQAVEAEMSVLGAVLINPDCLPDVANIITASDFYIHKHRWLFDAITALHTEGATIDTLTIVDRLQTLGQLAEFGGTAYIARLLTEVATSLHAEAYARIVKREATRRRLLEAASAIAKLAGETERAMSDVLADAEATLRAVSAGTMASIHSQSQAVGEFYDGMAHYIQHGQILGLTTGYPRLDRATHGFKRGELTIVAGRPSMGKTSFAAQVSMRQARAGLRVGVFSLEVSKRAWVEAAALAELGINKMAATESDLDALVQHCNLLDKLPVMYFEKGQSTTQEIEKALRQMERELGGIDMLWLDHLGYIRHPQIKGMNTAYAVGQSTKALARIGKEYQCGLGVLCQMSRDSARAGTPPTLVDLRDSGEIEQDARAVWFIHRQGYYADPRPDDKVPQEAQIRVEKNHDGPVGMTRMAWVGQYRRFAEYETRPQL